MKTLPPDHPEAGGYEADLGPATPFEEIDPPLRWTEHEKEMAVKAGVDLSAYDLQDPEPRPVNVILLDRPFFIPEPPT